MIRVTVRRSTRDKAPIYTAVVRQSRPFRRVDGTGSNLSNACVITNDRGDVQVPTSRANNQEAAEVAKDSGYGQTDCVGESDG